MIYSFIGFRQANCLVWHLSSPLHSIEHPIL
uniref:Uncharacterized protein n=1 Tax=Arundo donax TaxID=35708 RepID=A0A0A9BWV4_ARUDO